MELLESFSVSVNAAGKKFSDTLKIVLNPNILCACLKMLVCIRTEARWNDGIVNKTVEQLIISTCLHVCHSETDDSSSLPVAERSEVSPAARKPSLHLTLPDFQDASTGLSSSCTRFCRRAAVLNSEYRYDTGPSVLLTASGVCHTCKMKTVCGTFFPSLHSDSTLMSIIFARLHLGGANIFVGFLAPPHRIPQPVFRCGFSPGGGAL